MLLSGMWEELFHGGFALFCFLFALAAFGSTMKEIFIGRKKKPSKTK